MNSDIKFERYHNPPFIITPTFLELRDLTLSSPASISDLDLWLSRTHASLSCPRILHPPPMDRSRGDLRAGSKRSFDDFDSEEGRRLEGRLRERLEQGDLRRQRERDADRDWNRARSLERHRGEGYRREDDRRYAAGPSYFPGHHCKKKGGGS
jgi:hypothetical protein